MLKLLFLLVFIIALLAVAVVVLLGIGAATTKGGKYSSRRDEKKWDLYDE